jgi:hypothetical protein
MFGNPVIVEGLAADTATPVGARSDTTGECLFGYGAGGHHESNPHRRARMNNMDRWIDPRVKRVKAASLQAYLRRRGWREVPSPRPQLVMFEEPAPRGETPLVQPVPADEGGSDTIEGIVRAITNLAALEDRYAVEVLNDILQEPVGEPVGVNGPTTRPASRRKSTRT